MITSKATGNDAATLENFYLQGPDQVSINGELIDAPNLGTPKSGTAGNDTLSGGDQADKIWLNIAYTYSDFRFDNDPVFGNGDEYAMRLWQF